MHLLRYIFLVVLPLASAKCKCTPLDDCWPSEPTWSEFNSTIAGKLIRNEPIAKSCYQGMGHDGEKCQDIALNWSDNAWLAEFPTGYSYPLIEACAPINASLGFQHYPQCDLGNFPAYTVNATSAQHVAAAIEFAKDYNIRLVIKNTGHDIAYRSQGYGSLSIWVKYINEGLHYQESYKPSDKSCHANYTGRAIRIGGGYVWDDLYKFAHDHGSIVVGGGDSTVGTIGGYLQGGGHGPLSHEFGLGADNVLEWQAVLASGETVTANACQNQDLFAALRGGGGGTYGIVTSATIKAYKDHPVLGHDLVIAAIDDSSALVNATGDILSGYPEVVEEGFSGSAILSRIAGPLAYTHSFAKLLKSNSTSVVERAKGVMNQRIVEKLIGLNGTSLSVKSTFTQHPSFLSWYTATHDGTPGQNRPIMASRFLDKASLQSSPKKLSSLVETLIAGQGAETATYSATLFNLVAGGKVLEPQPLTAVNPAWRKTYVLAQQIDFWPDNSGYQEIAQVKRDLTDKKLKALKELTPGMGTYGNEADPWDPDWRNDWFGEDNYRFLLSVKQKYDPDNVFWCWRCVGNDAWAEVTGGALYGPLCEAGL
ncbi:hypothetical protein LMH87_000294 [Akanthomyces muscarius]|uniref:FAD-binding PCMH-type domain-containing protein n=1 Tax=Akanthomyces muscarius TaxID=2231603 RepID=A0A9W8UKZ5_AKAMU|nr:hypothetical protein LMH87_000294 [Akanthomyces muscarius]KAJ4155028.1 hypothetical protein LMH87_000294 [Akanthomyces muscarius]